MWTPVIVDARRYLSLTNNFSAHTAGVRLIHSSSQRPLQRNKGTLCMGREGTYALSLAHLHGFLRFPPKHSVLWQSLPAVQMNVVRWKRGGKLSTYDLEQRYVAALSKISRAPKASADKRRTPIYQRESATTERESIQAAANALAALWKIAKP